LSLFLAACRPSSSPTPPPIGSQVALRLTQTGAVPTATRPSHTPSPSQTTTPAPTATPSITPTPTISPTPTETGTATPVPRATVELGSLPYPPAGFGGDPHFYFGSPTGGFIASSYRYGSVGPGQRFAPHHGVDYSSPAGANVVAVAPGTIYYAGNDLERLFGPQIDFYGNLVVLQLAQTWNGRAVYALYGHLDQVFVQTGQAVATGEPLGTVGATGVALGPHPHLEVRLDFPDSYWDTRNPELWLTPVAGYGTLAVRVTNAAGFYLPGVRLDFVCADAAPRFMETYWYSGVNPDDVYFENAAMMNLPPGYCDFELTVAGQKIEYKDALVSPGTVSFVHIRIP
jgi:murein DD-endopeptidase MepM/ murein hydrolase activator NlpD